MRCQICNVILSDMEAVAKDELTGKYLDTCDACLLDAFGDLSNEEDIDLHNEFEFSIHDVLTEE